MVTLYSDIKYRIISNYIVLFIYFISMYIGLNNGAFEDVFLSVVICTAIGLSLYSMGICGGGDVKLLIALSPLFHYGQLTDLFFGILICGGLLSTFYWTKYRVLLKSSNDHGLPYGVAIIFGANLSLYLSQGLAIYS
ncbi:hypothetical protein FCV82_06495 [Vibrio breoganii]|nr:hypothetical protein FCV82_06495 [Vibrio breoganii]